MASAAQVSDQTMPRPRTGQHHTAVVLQPGGTQVPGRALVVPEEAMRRQGIPTTATLASIHFNHMGKDILQYEWWVG